MTQTADTSTPPAELPGVGIRVGGQLVAWFADPEMAEAWASENFFGQWLAHPCSMPNRPPFTPEQLAEARREAEKLYHLLGTPRQLSED
jgi:hypothetical protein